MQKYILIIFSLALLPLQLFAAVDQTTRDYLRNQPIDAWVAIARGAIGDTVYHPSLNGISRSSVTDLEKFILALVANGANPEGFGGANHLENLLAQVKNGKVADERTLNDDAWGLLAMRAAGLPTTYPAVAAVRRQLILAQNTDGGWSYVVSGGSDTNDTAAVMMALLEAGVSPIDPSMQRALGYLAQQQNEDGGFSYDRAQYTNSDGASDAWVLSALTKAGSDPTLFRKNGVTPIDHLRALARPDGCYTWQKGGLNCAQGITAWAVIALEGKSYPIRGTPPPVTPIPQPRPTEPPPTLWGPTNPWTGVVFGPSATSVSSRPLLIQNVTVAPTVSSSGQDSDGDGYSDAIELLNGYDPNDSIPCPRVVYSTTLKNPYGGARLAHVANEACRMQYVRRELERTLGKRLRISSGRFATLANAFLYGGYTMQDIAMAAKGAKTVYPNIYKEFWGRRK